MGKYIPNSNLNSVLYLYCTLPRSSNGYRFSRQNCTVTGLQPGDLLIFPGFITHQKEALAPKEGMHFFLEFSFDEPYWIWYLNSFTCQWLFAYCYGVIFITKLYYLLDFILYFTFGLFIVHNRLYYRALFYKFYIVIYFSGVFYFIFIIYILYNILLYFVWYPGIVCVFVSSCFASKL